MSPIEEDHFKPINVIDDYQHHNEQDGCPQSTGQLHGVLWCYNWVQKERGGVWFTEQVGPSAKQVQVCVTRSQTPPAKSQAGPSAEGGQAKAFLAGHVLAGYPGAPILGY